MKKKQSPYLVKFVLADKQLEHKYPFQHDKTYVYLGELTNMPGHCVVAEYPSGRIWGGYHIDNFVKIKKSDT